MENARRYTRYILIGGLAILMLIIIIIVGTSSESKTKEPTASSLTQTPEQHIHELARDALGPSNRFDNADQLSGSAVAPVSDGGYIVLLNFTVNDNLSKTWIIGSAKDDVRDTMEALYTSGINIRAVQMVGSFPLIDDYGNSAETKVLDVTLFSDTAARINWEGISEDMLFRIVDSKKLHPSFE